MLETVKQYGRNASLPERAFDWRIGTVVLIATLAIAFSLADDYTNAFWPAVVGLAAVLSVSWLVCAEAFGAISLPVAVVAYFAFYFVAVPIAQYVTDVADYGSAAVGGMHLALFGAIAFTVGTLLVRLSGFSTTIVNHPVLVPRLQFLYRPEVIVFAFLVGSMAMLGAWRLGLSQGSEPSGVLGIISSTSSFLTVATTASVALWMKTRSRLSLLLVGAAVFISLIHGLLTMSKWMLLIPFVDALLVVIIARQKFPLTLIVALGLGYFLVVAPLVGTMRHEKQVGGVVTEQDFVAVASESLDKSEFGTGNPQQMHSILQTMDRAGPRMLGAIVEMTGTVTPYEDGATYVWALETVVPRVLWPGKPPTNVGNHVGHKYLIIADDDFITGVSPGLIGEMYMNFGVYGALSGMLLLGVLTACFQEILLRKIGSGGLAYCFSGFFFSQESAIAHCVVPALKSFIVLTIGLTALQIASSIARRFRPSSAVE